MILFLICVNTLDFLVSAHFCVIIEKFIVTGLFFKIRRINWHLIILFNDNFWRKIDFLPLIFLLILILIIKCLVSFLLILSFLLNLLLNHYVLRKSRLLNSSARLTLWICLYHNLRFKNLWIKCLIVLVLILDIFSLQRNKISLRWRTHITRWTTFTSLSFLSFCSLEFI